MILPLVRAAFLAAVLLVAACRTPLAPGTDAGKDAPMVLVKTGARMAFEHDFSDLKGRRVGLVTNQTARIGSAHLIDVIAAAPDVELVVLFGPEHGIRGDVEDGAAISDEVDAKTGIPIFSLYGTRGRPTLEMLARVDALVFDIQDVGARFYTFINVMGRSMQSAAEAGIPYVVLDRPNPLGGEVVDGFVLDSLHVSGVGLYPIPVQHGMTVGELALMIKGEALLPGLDELDLRVVRMDGWRREMLWSDTGLPWRATSPNIPSFETALVYPGTCFFEGTTASEGRGTPSPFLTIGAPWLDAQAAVERLNGLALGGVRFGSAEERPVSMAGVAEHPKFEGETIGAVTIDVTDPRAFRPLESGVAVLATVYDLAPENERVEFFRERWLGLLAGTDRLQKMLESGQSASEIVDAWKDEVEAFKKRRESYLLYD